MAGMVGDQWVLPEFEPMTAIPHCVFLTIYSGGVSDFMAMPFDQRLQDVAQGNIQIKIGKTCRFDQIVEAHTCMQSNAAQDKIVITFE